VPAAAIRTETRSTDTRGSARALAPALRGARVRLVTSPPHRARAFGAFRAAGIDACLHDTGSDVVPFESIGYLVPQASAIGKSETALHELAGIAWYRLRRGQAGAGGAGQ
jgi:uncharacterized SAM-binding protein YcdF (DUF218 family)